MHMIVHVYKLEYLPESAVKLQVVTHPATWAAEEMKHIAAVTWGAARSESLHFWTHSWRHLP